MAHTPISYHQHEDLDCSVQQSGVKWSTCCDWSYPWEINRALRQAPVHHVDLQTDDSAKLEGYQGIPAHAGVQGARSTRAPGRMCKQLC